MPMPASDMLCVISDLIDRINCCKIENEGLDWIIDKMMKEYERGLYTMAMRMYGMAYHRFRSLTDDKSNT